MTINTATNTTAKPVHTSLPASDLKTEVNAGGFSINGDTFEAVERPSADVKMGTQLKTITPETVTNIKTPNKEQPVDESFTIANSVGALLGAGTAVLVIGTFASALGLLGGLWALPLALAAGVGVLVVASSITKEVISRLK